MQRLQRASPNVAKLLSFLEGNTGTILLILIWWVVTALQLIDRVLLPTPIDTFLALWEGMFQGDLLRDFWLTLCRSLYAFVIATILVERQS